MTSDDLAELVRLVRLERWAAALRAAIAAWTERRLPELADLIDAIATHLPRDPIVSPIIVTQPEYAKWVAQIERVPPDPRIAETIIAWTERLAVAFVRGEYGVYGDQTALRTHFALVADVIGRIADVRLRARLLALAERPPGRTNASRECQRLVAKVGLAAIDDVVLIGNGAERMELEALLDELGAPRDRKVPTLPRTYLPDELWSEVARNPDDDEVRRVLGDALMERGDPRGLMFAAQLGPFTKDARTLLKRHWIEWLGDELARVVLRRSSNFFRGMLWDITVGPGSIPAWVYEATYGHRELVAVRVVRLVRVEPSVYGRFVASLPNVHTVMIDSIAIAQGLADANTVARLTKLEVSPRYNGGTFEQVLAPLEGLAVPEIAISSVVDEPTLARLGEMFPTTKITMPTRG